MARGNLTKIADAFGVNRTTVYAWCKSNKRFQEALDNQRGKTLDSLLNTAVSIAHGIPRIKNGKRVGWIEEPNAKVLTYLIGKYGQTEGFGDRVDVTSNGESIKADPVVVEIIDSRAQVTNEEEDSEE